MRPSIEFARATPAEDQAILALHREAGWPGTQLDGEVWTLRESGRLAGSVQLIELAPGLVLIGAVVVGASARGRGIGAEMVQKVLATRRAEWWLECREQRIAFYERLGFTTAPGVEVDQRVRTRVGPNSTRQQHFLRISTLDD